MPSATEAWLGPKIIIPHNGIYRVGKAQQNIQLYKCATQGCRHEKLMPGQKDFSLLKQNTSFMCEALALQLKAFV